MRAGLVAVLVGAVAGRLSRLPRVRRAVHVLRGRPIVYGVELVGTGIVVNRAHTRIESTTIRNAAPGAGVTIR